MFLKLLYAFRHLVFSCLLVLWPQLAAAQTEGATIKIKQLCTPKVAANDVVASPKQRYDAGQMAQPPVTDPYNPFRLARHTHGCVKDGQRL